MLMGRPVPWEAGHDHSQGDGGEEQEGAADLGREAF